MRLTGGIISLIAGILGIFVGYYVLSNANTASVAGFTGANLYYYLALSGIIFSIIIVVLSVFTIATKSLATAILTIVASIFGMSGGIDVSICMIPAFIGGLLATLGSIWSRVSAPN